MSAVNERIGAASSDCQDAASAYDENGVDRSLIRWMLRLSPTQRLDFLQSSLDMLASARPLNDGPR